MNFLDFIKAIVFGIVEGITEWLPVSSTGHMILLEKIMPLNVSEAFMEMFLVVVQLGAVLAVVVIYWNRLWPLKRSVKTGRIKLSRSKVLLWCKIVVACFPAAIVGLTLDDFFEKHFYNYISVAIALIVVGILFIIVENRNQGHVPEVTKISDISWRAALIIGGFQVIAAIFPGVSRSGATILGAILIGVSRSCAAEFTFYLAIPVMFGASLLKVIKLGLAFSFGEILTLIISMVVAFAVSMAAIKFLVGYVKKHNFTIFGFYRIILGVIVLLASFLLK